MAITHLIHTDGSVTHNPGGTGGWAYVVVEDGNPESQREDSGGLDRTTNNRMELLAAIEALNTIPDNAGVEILTDSSYVVFVGNARGRAVPAKNADLWEILRGHQRRLRSLRFRWVRGHAGNELNERCDRLAKEASHRSGWQLDAGYKPASKQRRRPGRTGNPTT